MSEAAVKIPGIEGEGHSSSHLARGKKKHLIFSLSGKRYGIPLFLVKEVIGVCNVTPIPNVPSFYKGMINLRGQIISVIDLRIKLGFKEAQIIPKQTSIIITYVGDIVLGSIVDEVLAVEGFYESQLELDDVNKNQRQGEGIYGVAKDDQNELTLLINIERALDNTDFKYFEDQAS